MRVPDFFWVFLIVIALQPLFKQKFFELSRKRLLARMEQQRASRMILADQTEMAIAAVWARRER